MPHAPTLRAGCASTAFSTFICSSLDDGTRYLRRDPSIDCDDPAHKAMEGYAIIAILVWPVTWPEPPSPPLSSPILSSPLLSTLAVTFLT